MAKCVLGKKKHKLCEDIAGKTYFNCYTTRTHYIAECWYDQRNADYVNYQVRHFWPAIRNGQTVETPPHFVGVGPNQYRCAACGNVYNFVRDKNWNQEKIEEEYKTLFPGASKENRDLICDDCWQLVKPNGA